MHIFKDMPVESQAWAWVTSLVGSIAFTEWCMLIGAIVTVCSYIRESRYKKRMLELEEIRIGVRDKNGKLINERKD